MTNQDIIKVYVDSVTDETESIRLLRLISSDREALPTYEAGAHIDVHLHNGMIRQYSLTGDPVDKLAYNIAVLNQPNGRGGSLCIHSDIKSGDTIKISQPHNHFPLDEEVSEIVLIAGGIGITPILSMAYRLLELGHDFALHYCTLRPEKTAFYDLLLASPFSDKVMFYHDEVSPDDGLKVGPLLEAIPATTPVYCCGPEGLLRAVLKKGEELGKEIRFERFAAVKQDSTSTEGLDEFNVEVVNTGVVLHVGPQDTILDVLLDNDIDIKFKCEEGLCGTCIVDVVDGLPDHRDSVMNASDHASNAKVATCCSRSITPLLKIRIPAYGTT